MNVIPTRFIGMAWYRRETYARVIAVSKDAQIFSRSYDDWLAAAEQREREAIAHGFTVVRADIDPDSFPAWCAVNGVQVDSDGRKLFASFVADSERRRRQVGN